MRSRPGFFTLVAILGLCVVRPVGAAPAAPGQALYGFGPVSGKIVYFGFTIDPETGVFHRLASLGNRNFHTHPAFDPGGPRLFILAPPPDIFSPAQLLTLELLSGAVTSEASVIGSGFLEYSTSTRVLYALGSPLGPYNLNLYARNPATHSWTTLAYFQGASVWTSALDDAGQRLFFLGGSPDGPSLFVVNLQPGGVSSVSSVPIVDIEVPYFSLHFDSGRGVLYGVGGLAGESASSIFSVDPASGVLTRLAPLSDGHVLTAAFDPGRRRLYFTTYPPETLSTFDVGSGLITAVSIERCCPDMFVGGGTDVAVPSLGRIPAVLLAAMLALVGVRFVRGMA